MTGEGQIILNKIEDVVDSGRKEVFMLETESGRHLKLTTDHELWTGERYQPLSTLTLGDIVYLNPGKPILHENRSQRPYREEVYVKYHSKGHRKTVNGHTYSRLMVHQAVYEAEENKMSYRQYIEALNTWPTDKIDKLWVIPKGFEIHHRDENTVNNELENLALVKHHKAHNRIHLSKSKRNIAVFVQPDRVVAITKVGVEQVYDIRCADPYRNFVAGGIVVHNCGKTLMGKAAASALAKIYKGEKKSTGFIYIKGPEILSKWVGETESTIRQVFQRARKHKETHGYPAIIFIDEADSVLSTRGSSISSDVDKTIVPMFLAEMDGMDDSGALVVLATNRSDALDPAVVRDGRIDRKIRIGRPDAIAALEIFSMYLRRVPIRKEHTHDELAQVGVQETFRPDRILYKIRRKTNNTMDFTLGNIINGGMIASIVDHATSIALDLDLERGEQTGLGRDHLVEAINRVDQQNRNLNHKDDLDEFIMSFKDDVEGVQRYFSEACATECYKVTE
jgi:hypothetical protein